MLLFLRSIQWYFLSKRYFFECVNNNVHPNSCSYSAWRALSLASILCWILRMWAKKYLFISWTTWNESTICSAFGKYFLCTGNKVYTYQWLGVWPCFDIPRWISSTHKISGNCLLFISTYLENVKITWVSETLKRFAILLAVAVCWDRKSVV